MRAFMGSVVVGVACGVVCYFAARSLIGGDADSDPSHLIGPAAVVGALASALTAHYWART